VLGGAFCQPCRRASENASSGFNGSSMMILPASATAVGFAMDSSLEGAVSSEPVSVWKFSLLAANLQGISLDSASPWHFRGRKHMSAQLLTEPIP
jgi:hypothetical protein